MSSGSSARDCVLEQQNTCATQTRDSIESLGDHYWKVLLIRFVPVSLADASLTKRHPSFLAQAQDRAHRIGQTREVRVLRLTCANTMEEDILERTTYKKELGGAAIDGGMFNEKSTEEDRHAFLRKIFSRSRRVKVAPPFVRFSLQWCH